MDLEMIFLGTSCMVPTKERNHPGIFVSYNGEGILVDCGENTQRQLKIAKVKPSKIKKILITHWHGDHVLGLPGLLQTISGSNYEGCLHIYGPEGTKEFFKHMMKAFVFDNKVDIKLNEISRSGKVIDEDDYYIEAYKLKHRITCFGFSIVEKDKTRINLPYVKKFGIKEGPLLGQLQKGKDVMWKDKKIEAKKATYLVKGRKIGIISDTEICNNCFKIGQDADILVSESTFASDLKENAEEHMHLTAQEAGQVAARSDAKRLILTHLSQRYKSPEEILKDASMVFKNVEVAYDFMKARP